MKDSVTTQGNDGVFITNNTQVKPKNIIDAISEIQQMFVQERQGAVIDENFFTSNNTLEFFEVGFKGAFASGIIAALFTPLAFAVLERTIPVFGSMEPSRFDQAFVLMMATFLHIGYALFLCSLGKYYVGHITRQMINWLAYGVTAGAALKGFIIFIFYHWLSMKVATPESVAEFLSRGVGWVSVETLQNVYWFMLNINSVLIPAAHFVAIATVVFIAIPTASILWGSFKYGRVKKGF